MTNNVTVKKSGLRLYFSGFTGLVPLFILAHFSFHLIGGLLQPLLPAIRTEFALDYTQVGFLLGAFHLTTGFANLPAGWLADRLGPRLLITVAIVGTGLGGILISVAPTYALLVVFLILMAATGGGYHVSAPPLIAASTKRENQGAALGLHMIGGTGSLFIAPLFAVGIASIWGWRGPYMLISLPIILFGMLFFVLMGRHLAAEKADAARKSGEEAVQTTGNPIPYFSIIKGPLLPFLMLSVLSGAVVMSAISFLPLLLADHFGASQVAIGVFVSLIPLGGLITSPFAGYFSDRLGTERLMIGMALMGVPLIILLNYVPYGILLGALLMAIGVVTTARIPVAESFIITNAPKHLRSRVLAIFYFGGSEVGGLLTPLIGNLVDRFGFSATLFMAAGMLLIISIGCSYWLRKAQNLAQKDAVPFN